MANCDVLVLDDCEDEPYTEDTFGQDIEQAIANLVHISPACPGYLLASQELLHRSVCSSAPREVQLHLSGGSIPPQGSIRGPALAPLRSR